MKLCLVVAVTAVIGFWSAQQRMRRMRGYLENGSLELDNNCAERSTRCVAMGRKIYLLVGSEGGSIAYPLIETDKLNCVDPQVWLTWVLAQIADYKATKLGELMPWRYAAAAAYLEPIRLGHSGQTERLLSC